jgi:hypothetical protein
MPKDEVKKDKREAKKCESCGAKMWQKDHMTGLFNGPYHFIDCATLPGNTELMIRNLEDQAKWEEERFLPKKVCATIWEAIDAMMKAPSKEAMQAMKAEIHTHIDLAAGAAR